VGSAQSAHYIAIATDDASMTSHVPLLLFSDPDWLTTLADLVEEKVRRV